MAKVRKSKTAKAAGKTAKRIASKEPRKRIALMQAAHKQAEAAEKSRKTKTKEVVEEDEPNPLWCADYSQRLPVDKLKCQNCDAELDEIKPIKELSFGKPSGSRVVYSHKKNSIYTEVEVTWTPSFIRNRDYCQNGEIEPEILSYGHFNHRTSNITLAEIKLLKEFRSAIANTEVSCTIYFCDFCRKESYRTKKQCENHIKKCKAKRDYDLILDEDKRYSSKLAQELLIKLNANKQKFRNVKFVTDVLEANPRNTTNPYLPAKYSKERIQQVCSSNDRAFEASAPVASTSASSSALLLANDFTSYPNSDLDMKYTWDDSRMTIRQKLEHFIAQAHEERGQNDESD
jgi:hypothetical protein